MHTAQASSMFIWVSQRAPNKQFERKCFIFTGKVSNNSIRQQRNIHPSVQQYRIHRQMWYHMTGLLLMGCYLSTHLPWQTLGTTQHSTVYLVSTSKQILLLLMTADQSYINEW